MRLARRILQRARVERTDDRIENQMLLAKQNPVFHFALGEFDASSMRANSVCEARAAPSRARLRRAWANGCRDRCARPIARKRSARGPRTAARPLRALQGERASTVFVGSEPQTTPGSAARTGATGQFARAGGRLAPRFRASELRQRRLLGVGRRQKFFGRRARQTIRQRQGRPQAETSSRLLGSGTRLWRGRDFGRNLNFRAQHRRTELQFRAAVLFRALLALCSGANSSAAAPGHSCFGPRCFGCDLRATSAAARFAEKFALRDFGVGSFGWGGRGARRFVLGAWVARAAINRSKGESVDLAFGRGRPRRPRRLGFGGKFVRIGDFAQARQPEGRRREHRQPIRRWSVSSSSGALASSAAGAKRGALRCRRARRRVRCGRPKTVCFEAPGATGVRRRSATTLGAARRKALCFVGWDSLDSASGRNRDLR